MSSRWQLRQTPCELLLAERAPSVAAARSARKARTGPRGTTSTVPSSARAGSPHSSAQRRDVAAGRRLEPRLVDAARDGVDLAAERRHPPAVDSRRSRARDVVVHDRVGGGDHPFDRDGAVRVAEQPVELVPLDDDLRLVGALAAGASVIAGQLGRRTPPIAARTTTGTTVQTSSSLVEPWICGPSSVRGALAAPVADHERDQRALDEQEDDRRRRRRRRCRRR